MRTRLGLGVGRDEVRAVLVRDGRVTWSETHALAEGSPLADQIASVLSAAPRRRMMAVRVVAAIGPAQTQVKRLEGVPAGAKSGLVSQLVGANVGRFFLKNGVPLTVTAAYLDGDAWWGSVIDAPVVAAIQEGCERARLRLDGCMPAISALVAAQNRDGDVECADDGVRMRLRIRKGRWIELRREHGSGPADPVSVGSPGLPDARFASAYAAALSSTRAPLMVRPAGKVTRWHRAIRVGLAAATIVSLVAAIVAPGLAATRALARDTARLDQLRGTMTVWAPAMNELQRTTSALNEIVRFRNERRSAALLLASITGALPDSTAIVSLRVDSAVVTMTLLSNAASSVIPRLAGVAFVVEPKLVGAVTRESVSGHHLQRMTVRFRVRSVSGAGART